MGELGVSMQAKLEALFRGAQPSTNVRALCDELGMSRDTYYRLKRRFAEQGLDGLAPRSRRPHRSPRLLDAELEDEIVWLRKNLPLDNGAWSIRQELLRAHGAAPAESTIHRALVRRGMVTPQPHKRPKSAVRRFEFARPRDCWQMDISEWERADGSEVFIIDIEDDCSRKCVAAAVTTQPDSAAVWQTALKAFADNGLPGMFLTDNGRVFTGKYFTTGAPTLADFEANLAALGIRTVTSSPFHPQTCGKIERFHQTLKRWLRKHSPAATTADLEAEIEAFRDYYNYRRPHRALVDHGRHQPASTPQQRWEARAHGGPADGPLQTPVFAHTPLVMLNGTISVGTRTRIQVGKYRAGQRLTALRQGTRVLIFDGSQLIGDRTIDPTRRYQPNGIVGGRRKVSDMS
jgi:transposase InsO family protein